MVDVARLLGDTQNQVVILAAFEAGTEPTNLVDQRATQHRKVCAVVLAAKALRRPVGLVERSDNLTRWREMRFVAIRVVDVGMHAEHFDEAGQRYFVEQIVMVEQRNEVASGHRQRIGRGSDDATVLAAMHHLDALVRSGGGVEQRSDYWIGRAIVNEAQFPVVEGLRNDRIDHRQQHIVRWVVHRREHREQRGHRRNFLPTLMTNRRT